MRWNGWIAMGCAVLGVCAVCVGDGQAQVPSPTVVAQGLFGPRGLSFGPDGNLYVATSGTGGSTPNCADVAGRPVAGAPWYGGPTASILKIDPQGNVTTLATGFPSAFNPGTQSVDGVGDVTFLDGELYAVTAGGGCAHGNPAQPNMVAKVDLATGKWTMIADMSAVETAPANTPANPDYEDYQPDGDFYSLIADQGKLYTVDPNHSLLWSVTKKGEVQMVTDISALSSQWIGPTSMVASDGGLLVSNLGPFPITPDASLLMTLRPGCGAGTGLAVKSCGPGTLHISAAATPGLTTVVSMASGPDGLLYALELSEPRAGDPPPFFPNPGDPSTNTPGEGKVVRLRNGVVEDVITGLSVPTAMTFGPDGALYVSNWGAAAAPIGQILRFNVN